MRTASVGEVQKNFAAVLKSIQAGEEITITRHGRAVAKLTALGPKSQIDWPEFFEEAIEVQGISMGDLVFRERGDRFE